MNIWYVLGFAIAGYLIGSISFARLVSRIVSPTTDLDNVEIESSIDGTKSTLSAAGATTASIALGPKVGGTIAILDILKGFLPTLAVYLLFPDDLYFLFTGAGTVIGHVRPLYYKFRGGWGMSPMLGTFFVLDPIGVIVTNVLALLLGLYVIKDIIFMLTGGTALMIVWLLVVTGKPVYALYALVVNLLLFLAMVPELIKYQKDKSTGNLSMASVMNAMPMGRMIKKMMPGIQDQEAPSEALSSTDSESGAGK